MTLYEAIYYRKSVRKFSMAPIAPAMTDKINNYVRHLKRLDPSIPCQVDILDLSRNKVRFVGPFRVKAPYYLMISVDKNRSGALLEAGYLAQQLVLYLTAKSIGTCYQGGLRCLNITPAQGMKQAMLIAFGNGREEIFRNPEQAKRKPLNKLCVFREAVGDELRTLLKAARMAPSAFNRQPWRFAVYGSRLHILARERAGLKLWMAVRGRKASGKMCRRQTLTDFDMGIMLCHLQLAAEEQWMDITFKQNEQLAENKLRKCRYVASLLIHQKLS